MAQSIFVNLAVESVQQSRAFYAGLGFGINEQYSNEQAACVVIRGQYLCDAAGEAFFCWFYR
ncbi:hypothetical protein L2745_04575 [Shewanella xiamenensis]|uniref:VOC family protein n=1 Tax=Shewanella xiamenensis TaxID=332186 RepID=UPI0019CED855|nr:hypothetical protein [Shewanella xiamenensis]MCL1069906.1 hypothetical protein [Shewanella xiamenensis]GGM89162.1 hypothetical protein GCM10009124_15950 [Shewanella xiamenensis]